MRDAYQREYDLSIKGDATAARGLLVKAKRCADTEAMMVAARAVVESFLLAELGLLPGYTIAEESHGGWAFFVLPDDTTSYVHCDLEIEWYGTSLAPTRGEEGEDG